MTGKFSLPVLCLLAAFAHADDQSILRARNLAANCTPCHSPDAGLSAIPAIAGRPAGEILQRLRDYRAGEVPATVMHQISRAYGDAQLAALANYFAALPAPRP